jgi:hypothetical protein
MLGAVLRSGQKPEMAQRRHLGIRGLKRVSLLRFFARLQSQYDFRGSNTVGGAQRPLKGKNACMGASRLASLRQPIAPSQPQECASPKRGLALDPATGLWPNYAEQKGARQRSVAVLKRRSTSQGWPP